MQVAQAESTYPAIHIDFNPEVWTYQKQIGSPQVLSIDDGLCSYIWQIFVYIITFAFCCGGEFPSRMAYQVTHVTTETFTCRDSSRISIEDIKRILAYLSTPYRHTTNLTLDNAARAIAAGERAFSIVGTRTTANWQETSRLGISYNFNGNSMLLTSQSRAVPPLASHRDAVEGPRRESLYDAVIQSGASFVLQQDDLEPATVDGERIRLRTFESDFMRKCQLRAALRWLGDRNIEVNCNIFALTFDQAFLRTLLDVDHSGRWIVSLQENNGRRSIKFGLQLFPPRELHESEAALRPLNVENLIIRGFVDRTNCQMGWEVTLRG